MGTPVSPSGAAGTTAASEDKTVAIVSYITLIGFIAAILMHQNNKTQLGAFHLRQVLGLILTAVAGAVINVIPILGWIAWIVIAIALFIFWVMGLIAALNGQMRPIPILGAQYQSWFAGAFT